MIDSAAIIALNDSHDQFHAEACSFFAEMQSAWKWYALRITTHEAFTATRYERPPRKNLERALVNFQFARAAPFQLIDTLLEDEGAALDILTRTKDQDYSFHDALCAAVMKRMGIMNVFTFDHHFWSLGFTICPGKVNKR